MTSAGAQTQQAQRVRGGRGVRRAGAASAGNSGADRRAELGDAGRLVTAAAGVVLDEDCFARLDAAGFVVWLRARSAALADRIQHSGDEHRPFVAGRPGAVLERLAPQREPRYAAIADAIVDTDDLSVGTIASDVVVQFRAAG